MHSSPQQKSGYCGTSAGRLGGSRFTEKYGTVCLSIVSTMARSVAFLGCLVFLVGGLSPGGGCEKWVFGAFEGFLGTFFESEWAAFDLERAIVAGVQRRRLSWRNWVSSAGDLTGYRGRAEPIVEGERRWPKNARLATTWRGWLGLSWRPRCIGHPPIVEAGQIDAPSEPH